MAKINETLRQLRQDRGMTQEEVAEQVGLTRQAVSSYESGRTQPGVDILQRLADIYEVELTDIIYGRSRALRLYRALKVTAIVMAVVFLAAQLAEALLLWIANQFFALEPGVLTEAEKITLETRAPLIEAWEAVGGLYYGLFPLCCVALLVLTLCLRRPLAAKTKLLSALSFAAASMVVVLPWALTDSLFGPTNYLIMPGLCLIRLAFFLLLSLAIDFCRARKLRRDAEPTEEQEKPAGEARPPLFRRWWLWLWVAAGALLLILLAVSLFGDTAEMLPVDDPAFSLNGEDYPQAPVLQDFLDRGWKRSKSAEQTGRYNEDDEVTDLVSTGYRLTCGENHVTAYLNVDDCRNGLEPGQCRLRSLSLYGGNVMSFSLDGKELGSINSESILDALGEPDAVDEQALGVHYDYSMPEKGISKISFSFPGTLDTVGQIFVVFDI